MGRVRRIRFHWTRYRFIALVLFLHILFALTIVPEFRRTGNHNQLERYIAIVALTTALVFYSLWVLLSAIWAARIRLNLSLAFQKFYWLLLIASGAYPAYTGWYPVAPQWVRVYCWLGVGLCTPWVVYELAQINGWMRRLSIFLFRMAEHHELRERINIDGA